MVVGPERHQRLSHGSLNPICPLSSSAWCAVRHRTEQCLKRLVHDACVLNRSMNISFNNALPCPKSLAVHAFWTCSVLIPPAPHDVFADEPFPTDPDIATARPRKHTPLDCRFLGSHKAYVMVNVSIYSYDM